MKNRYISIVFLFGGILMVTLGIFYSNKEIDYDVNYQNNEVSLYNTIISKKGATEYGPSYAISNLVSTIITDTHKVLTVSSYLDGEIGDVYDVSLGVPVVLSKKGVAMIVPLHMNDFELHEFKQAAKVVKETTEDVLKSLNE